MERFLTLCGIFLVAFVLPVAVYAEDDGEGDDEEHDIKFAIQGPVDATDCTATPPTVTILGLKIDVSNLVVNNSGGDDRKHGGDDQGGDNQDGNSQGDDGGDDDNGGGGTSCSSIVGKTLHLDLVNDQSPLVATHGSLAGGYDNAI